MSNSNYFDHKLYSLFQSLTGVEKRELHHFLASPFFNRRAEVRRLWEYLSAQKDEKNDAWKKTKIHEHLFPGEPYDDPRLRYTLTFLREKIEWFLAYRQWDRQAAAPKLALATAYRERRLEKHFRHAVQLLGNEVDSMSYGLARRDLAFRLELEKHAFSELRQRSGESTLQAVHDAFDLYVLSGKLRFACLMAAHQAVVRVEYDYSFLTWIVRWLEGNKLLAEPEIGMYYHCYKALTENSEAHFRAFRQVLESQGAKFDAAELKDILMLAVNFCIRQLNAGSSQYVQEAFDLYRWGLGRDMLTEQGVLSRFTYKNIVALGLGLKQFEWVEHFLHEWQSAVEERYRESSFYYNLAKLRFAKKDYRQAMPLLARVGDADFLMTLDAKVLLLKMYVESGEWEALESLIVSFRSFLRRKTSLGYHKEHYISLLRYTRQLLVLNRHDRSAVQALRDQIAGDTAVLEREWLLGQMP